MVDIPNHEDSLRELAKTSLVNNVTVILCWSAAEAARYLELYKSYEHANFSAIKGQQATGYAEKLVEFVTIPRSVNKADAVALVSTFGSLRNAINADPEQVAVISGWGERKVKSWCKVVEAPFRVKKAARRRVERAADDGSGPASSALPRTTVLDQAVPIGRVPLREMAGRSAPRGSGNAEQVVGLGAQQKGPTPQHRAEDADEDAMIAATIEASKKTDSQLSDGVAAALARLRENG